jgi:hypothetical protein
MLVAIKQEGDSERRYENFRRRSVCNTAGIVASTMKTGAYVPSNRSQPPTRLHGILNQKTLNMHRNWLDEFDVLEM